MKNYLISSSLLNQLIQGKNEALLKYLENLTSQDNRFFTTALSLFEIIQVMDWGSREEQKEFLSQSGILCQEVFPITQEDLDTYIKTTSDPKGWKGLEWIEVCVGLNRRMDALLVFNSNIQPNPWIEVIDLNKVLSKDPKI